MKLVDFYPFVEGIGLFFYKLLYNQNEALSLWENINSHIHE
jgi:hypothetical protein